MPYFDHSIATYTQPDPVPNNCGFVVDELLEEFTGVVDDRLLEDLKHRRDLGIERYGTALQYNNGRLPLVDAYQEVLDAIVYLQQSREYTLRDEAIEFALRLRLLAQIEFDRLSQ